jgi:hypothetical protein
MNLGCTREPSLFYFRTPLTAQTPVHGTWAATHLKSRLNRIVSVRRPDEESGVVIDTMVRQISLRSHQARALFLRASKCLFDKSSSNLRLQG